MGLITTTLECDEYTYFSIAYTAFLYLGASDSFHQRLTPRFLDWFFSSAFFGQALYGFPGKLKISLCIFWRTMRIPVLNVIAFLNYNLCRDI